MAVLRRICKIFSSLVLIAVVLLAVLLAGVRLIGFTPYTVLSGSMEPNYHVGSVIYVAKVDPTELQVNDPITYKGASGVVVTNRIIEIRNADKPAALSFITKGDANKAPDGTPVPAAAVIGKPCFTVPYLGYLSNFVSKPQGLFAVVGVGLLAIVLSMLADILFPKNKQQPETNG